MIKSCYVSHRCPQCGGEAVFEQQATGTRCRYCGAGLMVLGGRSAWLNFLIKPQITVKETAREVTAIAHKEGWKPPLLRSVIPFYFPFYRATGQAIKWIRGEKKSDFLPHGETVEEVRTRHFDLMRPAHQDLSPGLFTPGVRAQTLHLYLATRENAGKFSFAPVQVDREEFLGASEKSHSEGITFPGIYIRQERSFSVWERYSVLYFPLLLVEVREGNRVRLLLIDAVGGGLLRQIGHGEMESLLDSLGIGGDRSPGEGRLKLVPLICPECAGDLQQGSAQVVRFCSACARGWEARGSRLRERSCLWAGTEEMIRDGKTQFLPFWRRGNGEDHCFVPAFGVRSPRLLYNLTLRYYNARFPAEPIPYNCRLRVSSMSAEIPAEEADEMIEVVTFTSGRKPPEGRDDSQVLVLVPFRRRGTDLIDHYHGLAVPTGSLDIRT